MGRGLQQLILEGVARTPAEGRPCERWKALLGGSVEKKWVALVFLWGTEPMVQVMEAEGVGWGVCASESLVGHLSLRGPGSRL